MEKLTILHVTDPHWICQHWNLPYDRIEWQSHEYDEMSAAFLKLVNTDHFKAHFSGLNVLVHTGDSANFYEVHKVVPISEQFNDIKNHFLPLIEGAAEFTVKLAVPGNHDVSRNTARGEVTEVSANVLTCRFAQESLKSGAFLSDGRLKPSFFKDHPHELFNTKPNTKKRSAIVSGNNDNSLILANGGEQWEAGETFVLYPTARFGDFTNTFEERGWITSASQKSVTVSTGKRRIRFWLVNSSERCGKDFQSDGTPLDLVQINDQDIRRWKDDVATNGVEDDLRISLLHHTPLPNYGARNQKQKKDVFINNADFNTALVTTCVRLVLSGHQHSGDLIYAAMPEHIEHIVGSDVPPFVETGFLCNCGPAFLRHEQYAEPGFCVIEIEFEDEREFGSVKLTRYLFSGKKGFSSHPFTYNIAFKGLRSIHRENPEEQERRLSVMREAIAYCYSTAAIDPLERILIKRPRKPSLDEWFNAYEQCRTEFPGSIYGLYSLSALTPASWWALELTRRFRPGFLEHAKMRDRYSRMVDFSNTGLNTGYSASILYAISEAIGNANRLNVEDGILAAERPSLSHEDDQFLRAMVRRNVQIGKSDLSVITPSIDAVLSRARFGAVVRNLIAEHATWDFPMREDADSEKGSRVIDRFEVARIALWPLKYFESDYSLRIIEFHQDFSVPFFWLHPDYLLGSNNEKRAHVGAFFLGTNGNPHARKLSYYNNLQCERVKSGDLLGGEVDELSLLQRVWGPDNVPTPLSGSANPIAAEFAYLCRRPDIMFTSDVYALLKMGQRTQLEGLLNERRSLCFEWATLKP